MMLHEFSKNIRKGDWKGETKTPEIKLMENGKITR
jgi:hypothetical protein